MKARIILISILLLGCAGQKAFSRVWTIVEVQEWYNKKYSSWDGILYRGSDKKMHRFVSRVRDEWYFFNIKVADLQMKDVRPVLKDTGSMGYYFVDPNNNFEKIKDY